MQKPFYKSLKFWYAVGGVAVVFIGHFLGMEIEKILSLAGVAGLLVGGQSAADFGKHAKAVEAEAKKFSEITNQIHFFQNMKTDVLDEEQKKKAKETLDKLLDMAAAIKR